LDKGLDPILRGSIMSYRSLAVALALLVCVTGSSLAQEQLSIGELEVRFNDYSRKWERAIMSGDYDAAEREWAVMRQAARTLVSKGRADYASWDRSMTRPDRPQSQPSGTPVPEPTPTSMDDDVPITVQIAEDLEIEVFGPCDTTAVEIDERQTGLESELTEIELIVDARIFDRSGAPYETDDLGFAHNHPDGTLTVQNGKGFQFRMVTQGFENLAVPVDIMLDGPCLAVDPPVVALGTLTPGSEASASFSIENTCDEPLEVTMPSPGDVTFDVRDCGGGPTNLGSAAEGGGQHALLGPSARCTVRVKWNPTTRKALNYTEIIETDEGLPLDCLPDVRVVGTSSDILVVTPAEFRFDGVTSLGTTNTLSYSVRNTSEDRTVAIHGFQIYGGQEHDFRLGRVTLDGARFVGQGPAERLVLEPGGGFRATIEFTPMYDGVRRAIYAIWIDDPDVNAVRLPMSGLAENAGRNP
jgi:hypothetical protein